MTHLKSFVRHIGLDTTSGIPVTPKGDWPDFPEAQKPSNQSPYRTVLWFHRHINNGVRILIEGKDKEAVEAYAKLVVADRSNIPVSNTDTNT